MRIFYSTREKYPASRVDLVDLFSRKLSGQFSTYIDWHMQKISPGRSELIVTTDRERFFLGNLSGKKGGAGKVINQVYALLHDCMIWKYVAEGEYDAVQVRDKFFAGVVALVAAKRKKIPFCFWISFPYPEADLYRIKCSGVTLSLFYKLFYFLRGQWTRFLLYKCILPNADRVFVQSQRMLEDIEREGIDRRKMYPVPMGVALERMSKLPKAVSFSEWEGRKISLYMGTMVRVRRLDFLLDVHAEVLKSDSEALLVMVGGESGDVCYLKGVSERLGISNSVIFTGQLEMEEAWSYVLAADVCLSPFCPSPVLDSTSPTKVVEYMALGKAVVVNDHPDQSAVVNQSCAGKVARYDVNDFAAVIVDMFGNPDRVHDMGKLGREYVENVRSYDVLAKQLAETYKELLPERRSS